jgi:hypothetical protein
MKSFLYSFAYFIGNHQTIIRKTFKIISLLIATCIIVYAVIRITGVSIEIKRADLVLWHID